jgi:hypothetical protein
MSSNFFFLLLLKNWLSFVTCGDTMHLDTYLCAIDCEMRYNYDKLLAPCSSFGSSYLVCLAAYPSKTNIFSYHKLLSVHEDKFSLENG